MPIHETIQRSHKVRSGIALGGIGTGSVEIRKDGCFYNWNLFNNIPFGPAPHFPYAEDSMLFFVVRYEEKGQHPRMKILQVDQGYEVGTIPSHYYTFPWMTGVDAIECTSSYPFTRMTFRDKEMPFEIDLEAFSPFIPHDVKNSALPAAIFNFSIRSKSKNPVDVMLLATLRNAVGYDCPGRHFTSRIEEGAGYKLFEMSCGGMDTAHDTWGTQCVASLAGNSSYYLGWEHRHPYYEYVIRHKALRNFDDTAGRNRTDKATGKVTAGPRLFSSIAASRRLAPRASFGHTFLVTWHFPNLYADPAGQIPGASPSRRLEGHYYSNLFADAAGVARYVGKNLKTLTARTRRFHDDFFDSTLPAFVLDQVNSQLNTFATSAWLTKAGDFGVQEGITQERAWGPLATIDVAMYGSVMTDALFPELSRSMMRAHQRLQGTATGIVGHGIGRDFSTTDVNEHVKGRLDLPSQYAIMALRAWFWSHDRDYLRAIWPSVTAALEYVLRERDMNGDLLPDMEGAMCTYDNFPMFGAASFVASQWLSALAHAAQAARDLGDDAAAERYAGILAKGEKVFEEKLWNGQYYRLYNDAGGQRGDRDEGCLSDQIIGQWANRLVGLPSLLAPQRVATALRTVVATNYRPDYGLLNCRWPGTPFLQDVDPNCWSDQANTCWSGVELAFSSFLIYEGFVREGLEVVRNVDDRYRKAGMYYDHQEFGGHYFRPMSAWANVNALLGLAIRCDRYEFRPRLDDASQRLFFAHGEGTAHYERRATKGGAQTVALTAHTGALRFRELVLGLAGRKAPRAWSVRVAGKAVAAKAYTAEYAGGALTLRFTKPVVVAAGQECMIEVR